MLTCADLRPADFGATTPHARRLLPERLARRHGVYPLRDDDRTITIATSNSTDVQVADAVGALSGRRVIYELAFPDAITGAIDAGYAHGHGDHVNPESPECEPGACDDSELRAARVLLVDDDAVMRLLGSTVLRTAGFLVDTSNDGAEAWHRLSAGERFSVIVTDLHMPNMGGEALLKAVRESMDHRGIPVIVLTGEGRDADEARLLDAGADDYFRKPINPARFVSRVRAALARSSLQAR